MHFDQPIMGFVDSASESHFPVYGAVFSPVVIHGKRALKRTYHKLRPVWVWSIPIIYGRTQTAFLAVCHTCPLIPWTSLFTQGLIED